MNAALETAIAPATMESYFHDLARLLDGLLAAGEAYTAYLSAEVSDFVRMNRGRVRQPGTVAQRHLEVDLIRGARHAVHRLALSGELSQDSERLRAAVAGLRAALPDLDDDPHLLVATDASTSRAARGGPLPPAEAVIDAVHTNAAGLDLVGLYAGGPVYRGFASSYGQRSWHEATSFNLQWSLYHRADKAVKTTLSGFTWDEPSFAARMQAMREDLARIALPAKTLAPGSYRCYLTPAAMEDVAGLLCWGGFSARGLVTTQSPLARMRDGGDHEGVRLAPSVTIVEATAQGVAPAFQHEGFRRADRVALIEEGKLVGSLVAPRTAREFDLVANGANGEEAPESLAMEGGALPMKDALAALGTGLYVGNLHYLNFSDRAACRMTGMTRFATFWVERGAIVAPVNVLRFDDTIFRMLGSKLEALTAETELILDSSTYGARSLVSMRLPGVLVSEIAFTL